MTLRSDQTVDVSVIIPTYNRLLYLQRALDSVLQQSCPPRETIVVDDGSDDGSWDWLRAFQREHQARLCLKLIAARRSGPAAARNAGALLAQGRWLAFLDSDDVWLPQKLEKQVSFLEQNPHYKIIQGEEIWIRKGKRVNAKQKHSKPSGEFFFRSLELCLVSPSAVMIDREFFWSEGGFDPNFLVCEDYELWLRMALRSELMTLGDPLIQKFGGHEDQLSRRYWGMDRFRVEAMLKLLFTKKLAPAQSAATLDVVIQKLKILAQGFQKRNTHISFEENPFYRRFLWLQKNSPYALTEEHGMNFASAVLAKR